MGERVGLRELARRLGCSATYVHKLKMQGVLEYGADGLIDEEAARTALEAARDPEKDYVRARYGTERVAENTTYHRAKTAREAIEARRAQVELDRLLGNLVNANDVQREYFAAARAVRDALLALPDRLATTLAVEADPRRVHELLSAEIEQTLNGLAAEFEREAAGCAAITA